MSKTTGVAAFIFGAAVGSAATWFFTKKYYAQLAQEEIDSVKEVFSRRADISNDESTEPENQEEAVEECNKVIDELGYSPEEVEPVGEVETLYDEPYVIEPNEFGTMFDYDQIELTYYADGVLTDDWNEPIDDIPGTVGADFAEHFGEYEEDSVYIRNDQKKAEYVICLDERNHSEVIRYKQNEVEME